MFFRRTEAQHDMRGLVRRMKEFKKLLSAAKEELGGVSFYPYDSLTNFYPLEQLLPSPDQSVLSLAGEDAVLDVGCGDGDVSFFMESLGCKVDAMDNSGTNFNRMAGVRALKAKLNSAVEIYDLDLDKRFELPDRKHSLALFFGTLYHLKNPFYVLETLAQNARWCILSTRVARLTPDRQTSFQRLPMAYLLDDREANGDPTNYWIFSETGLRRILRRSGWEVLNLVTTGDTRSSDPASPEADERAFCLLRSGLAV
jgi:SAM-dependent methyltransferase